MDRGRALALLLSPLPLLLAAADARSLPPIREARWLAPERVHSALGREPAECFARPADSAERRRAEIGRAAFRTPLLLGGQAARAGLSCAACHRNGRGNPDFLFPGLSGAAGTADVTASLMSRRRGDGRFNPRPIPDLAGPADSMKISRDPRDPALEAFIRGLIVEEFDGPEPPPEILAGLAAYVRAIRPSACGRGERRVTLASRLARVEAAAALAAGEAGGTRRLLLAAARSELGAIDERFAIPGGEPARAILREADRTLHDMRSGQAGTAGWLRLWPGWKRRLLRAESRSLFDGGRLRASLRGERNDVTTSQ